MCSCVALFSRHFLSLSFSFLEQLPAKRPYLLKQPPHTRLPLCPHRQPAPHIELETAILEDHMGNASVALPKATCQTDSHGGIYIVIPQLIALNVFIGGELESVLEEGRGGGKMGEFMTASTQD